MFRKNKKCQEAGGGSAAVFIAIIALMIILYILFLPPGDRAAILGDDSGSSTTSGTGTSTGDSVGGVSGDDTGILDANVLLLENPGLLSVQGDDRIHHFIPRVKLFDASSGTILEEFSSITVKRSLFDNKPKLLSFVLDDVDNTENVLMDFVVENGDGDIIIKFNDAEVYEGRITNGNIEPINIKKDLLQKNNLIEFSVSSPGALFWKTNEYYIKKIKLVGTVTDISHLVTKNKFYIADEEYESANKMELKYYPDCESRKVGPLVIEVNNHEVYSGTPSCNIANHIEFGPELIRKGDNDIMFSTTHGSYDIGRIDLKASIEEKEDYTYYFDLDTKYFTDEKEEMCGDVDGFCPKGCDEDEDVDCCFEESQDNFWCDLETDDADDRCVSAIDTAKCSRCLTGYEDEDGDPAVPCEDMCGDDTDDVCLEGCGKNYDIDCCYEDNENNYWCNEVPTSGLGSVCESSITSGECDDCASEYEDEGGDNPDECEIDISRDGKLKKGYKILLDFKFLDNDEEKEFELRVNGRATIIRTEGDSYSYDVSSKVEENYNSIRISPDKSFELKEIKVSLEE